MPSTFWTTADGPARIGELEFGKFSIADHGSYPARVQSKVGVQTVQVTFCDHLDLIEG